MDIKIFKLPFLYYKLLLNYFVPIILFSLIKNPIYTYAIICSKELLYLKFGLKKFYTNDIYNFYINLISILLAYFIKVDIYNWVSGIPLIIILLLPIYKYELIKFVIPGFLVISFICSLIRFNIINFVLFLHLLSISIYTERQINNNLLSYGGCLAISWLFKTNNICGLLIGVFCIIYSFQKIKFNFNVSAKKVYILEDFMVGEIQCVNEKEYNNIQNNIIKKSINFKRYYDDCYKEKIMIL